MSIKHLQEAFIAAMKRELPDWKFIATQRHFRKTFPHGNWLAHISFVSHPEDFDAVVDVSVEFLDGKDRLCVVGASLGNIEGVGQVRYSAGTAEEAAVAAAKAVSHFQRVGLPFLEHHSAASNVINYLKEGGPRAHLISPLVQLHAQQIEALARVAGPV